MENKQSVVEKGNFGYSPLVVVLTNNTKTKTNKNKLHEKNIQDKYLIYNSQYSFAKFKDSNDFKQLPFDSIHKRLNELYKKFGRFKNFSPQKKEKGILKEKVLSNAGELFNELYYIYKNIYNKEKHGSNPKDTKKRV